MSASYANGHLPILSGIQIAELRRLGATLFLGKRGTLDPDHILHGQLAGLLDVAQERVKSRRPFVPAARKLFTTYLNLASPRLGGRIIDGALSILNAYLHSMVLFPGPIVGPLEWACPENLGLSSIACGLELSVFTRPRINGVLLPRRIASVAPPAKPQTTLSQRAPYIGHLERWLV